MKIYLLPIEPFEERYTEQWLRYWHDELLTEGWEVEAVLGTAIGEKEAGEFLDPTKTWIWKGSQLAVLGKLFSQMRAGDIILNLDGWGPSTTAMCYMRDTTGKDVKCVAFFHAGAYDPHDFLARSGMRKWALEVERGWMQALDLIFVGSVFGEQILHDNLGIDNLPTRITGYPIHQDELSMRGKPIPWDEREQIVVFPHRIAPEKNMEFFDALKVLYARLYPSESVVWKSTAQECATKDEYYECLGKAKVSFSSAYQETFGIAMQESIALGAWAVCPNRLSYQTVIRGGGWLFDNLLDATVLVHKCLHEKDSPPWDGHHEKAIQRASLFMKDLIR